MDVITSCSTAHQALQVQAALPHLASPPCSFAFLFWTLPSLLKKSYQLSTSTHFDLRLVFKWVMSLPERTSESPQPSLVRRVTAFISLPEAHYPEGRSLPLLLACWCPQCWLNFPWELEEEGHVGLRGGMDGIKWEGQAEFYTMTVWSFGVVPFWSL